MKWLALSLLLALLACRELGLVEGSPHEQYQGRLSRAGLLETPLGREWLSASRTALADPVTITMPFRESGYFAAERPGAAGFRVRLRRGQRLVVNLARQSADSARLFIDLFRLPADSADDPDHLRSGDSASTGLDVEIDRDADYIIRLQPELLRSIRYTLTILGNPSLGMPVDGAGNADIKSGFGVERDAGRRSHEGIDIFAPRGTPVVAATGGHITNVGDNNLGGNVIWQWDPVRNQSLYYAHLDRQLARDGQQVEKGDTIGLVGNTGNARTTPPHLHFGIYPRGSRAIDPQPFVFRPTGKPPLVQVDSTLLGGWVRIAARRGARVAAESLPRGAVMRVNAATDSTYRVELPDGRNAVVARSLVERSEMPSAAVAASVIHVNVLLQR